ncbi:MAG: isoprenylcysteine carboxylmethyltransferase family protein [Meiothermus sp.]|nr:isoprenylcysteine carboxylmethyltransferase family protein [Meiothermus sp.]
MIWIALAFVVTQRLLELRLARRNLAWALSQGAKEYGKEHYPLFFLLHVGWMLGWLVEGLSRGQVSSVWWLWLGVFLLAQGLRYWAITSLGNYWNTRILIVPGGRRVASGPYRFIPHPNYVAVALELLSLPLVFNAWVTALAATVLNALLLLLIRIPAEERALREYNAASPQ